MLGFRASKGTKVGICGIPRHKVLCLKPPKAKGRQVPYSIAVKQKGRQVPYGIAVKARVDRYLMALLSRVKVDRYLMALLSRQGQTGTSWHCCQGKV